MAVVLKNKDTGVAYQVLGVDQEKGEIRLKGEHAEFTHKLDKPWFERMGYELVQE